MNRSRCALFAIAGALLAAAPASAAAPAPTWQPAVTVSSAASSNSAPQIAVNARGDSAAVWTETVNGKSVVRGASRVAGAGWSAPAKVPAGPVASTPRVGIDGAGRVYSAWA